MSRLACAALLTASCTLPVTASGLLAERGPETWIEAPSGKARPLSGAEVERLRHLAGLVVDVEGTLRRGAIEVESWSILQGPLGFEAHVGLVDAGVSGVVLREVGTGKVLGLHGDPAEALWDEVGQWVLVEGIVDGPLRVRVMGWRPLHETRR
ncbi:MAG: hypothetical protein H6732_05520 [Alphaproteobacteria bacterium]|nr:hypothetical protein [Alphaproteobacteria bacterium]